jgi:protein phosphatase
VQELFDCGEISEEEMRTHPCKNIITAGIIANDPSALKIFYQELPLRNGDRFFMCSDGVWEALPLIEIEETLSDDDFITACSELQKKLLLTECRDNISFVFIQ